MGFERLKAQPKKVEIAGEEFSLKPLTVRNLDIIDKVGKEETQMEGLREMMEVTFKQSGYDIDVNDISMEHLEQIQKAILEVNGFDAGELKSKALKQ